MIFNSKARKCCLQTLDSLEQGFTVASGSKPAFLMTDPSMSESEGLFSDFSTKNAPNAGPGNICLADRILGIEQGKGPGGPKGYYLKFPEIPIWRFHLISEPSVSGLRASLA